MNWNKLGRTLLFTGILACIAVILYAWQDHRDQRRAAEAASQTREVEQAETARKEAAAEQERKNEAARQAANEHARFIAQYENTNFTRTANTELIAVACAEDTGKMDQEIGDALASRFQLTNVVCTSSFFKPTLVTEGVFDKVFIGSDDMLKKLDLEKYLDGLLLARQDVQYSTNSDLNNVVTADMHLHVVSLTLSRKIENRGWTLAAKGSGFSPADARMQAEERIIKQIANDPKLTLKPTP
jgi:hypothetical protein